MALKLSLTAFALLALAPPASLAIRAAGSV
jgi:hypothetical protein